MPDLCGKTLFITGSSRGIGKAIALRAGADGANVSIVGKTAEPHPDLPGTVYSAVEDVCAAGGRGLACIADVRFEEQVAAAVELTVATFGGIDVLVNNASAIFLAGTSETPMKRYDLMQSINTRATFMTSRICLPHLLKADNPHVLTISPPLNLDPRWFAPHVGYTISKYGMSMCVLGMAEELGGQGVAVNALWPKTGIATAAINLLGGEEMMQRCRDPQIMADAAYAILTRDSRHCSGNFFVDEEVLKEEGVTNFDKYAVNPDAELLPDFFL